MFIGVALTLNGEEEKVQSLPRISSLLKEAVQAREENLTEVKVMTSS